MITNLLIAIAITVGVLAITVLVVPFIAIVIGRYWAWAESLAVRWEKRPHD